MKTMNTYKVYYQTTLNHWRDKNRKSLTIKAKDGNEAEHLATEELKKSGIHCRAEKLSLQLLELEVKEINTMNTEITYKTAEEALKDHNSCKNQSIKGKLVGREVQACVSSLVSEAYRIVSATGEEFDGMSIDDFFSIMQTEPDFEEAASQEDWEELEEPDEEGNTFRKATDTFYAKEAANPWLALCFSEGLLEGDEGHTEEEAEEEAKAENWELDPKDEDTGFNLFTCYGETSTADDWEELCYWESIDAEETRAEVYEHWAVSDWLGRKLQEHGQCVAEFGGLTVWGRCTTGQAILLDSVMGQIASEMEILEGQRNEWKD